MSFADSLVSDKGTVDNSNLSPEALALDSKIRQHIKDKGGIRGIEGVYGDFRGAMAYVEEVIKPGEGIFSKLYGCSYWYPGEVVGATVDSVAVTKGAYFETLKTLAKFPFYLCLPLFLLPAARREAVNWILEIYQKDLEKRQLKLNEYKQGIREIMRVCFKHFEKRLVNCFAMIFEHDNAYWFPAQDALSNLKWENVELYGVRYEVNRLFAILINRQNFNDGAVTMRWKVGLVKKLAMFALLIPKYERIAEDILFDLDVEKIKPTEAEIYFTLNRRAYDYRGIPFEERLKEWERINREKGHVILGV